MKLMKNILAFCFLFVFGVFTSKAQTENPLELTAKSIHRGKIAFKVRCLSCHGAPAEGKNIAPNIPDLGGSASIAKADGELYRVLTDGVGAMPSFKDIFSDKERWQFVNYIRSFDPKAKDKIVGTLTFPKVSLVTSADLDSKTVIVEVGEIKNGDTIPLKNLDMNFYAKRSFGNIAMFDEARKTNDYGMLTIPIPDEIPGDPDGNIEIIAKIADADNYGEVESRVSGKLAKASHPENILEGKVLWGAGNKIPIWLLLSYLGVVLIIWGGVFYSIFKLLGLKKLS